MYFSAIILALLTRRCLKPKLPRPRQSARKPCQRERSNPCLHSSWVVLLGYSCIIDIGYILLFVVANITGISCPPYTVQKGALTI